MPATRAARSLVAESVLRALRYSIAMPKRALNAAGSDCRTFVSGGPATTTLPSCLAAASVSSHVRPSGNCALASGASIVTINRKINFFIVAHVNMRRGLSADHRIHATADALLGQLLLEHL